MLKLPHLLSIFQFIWLFSIITLGPVTYGGKEYPAWAVQLGWGLGSISIIPIPLVMIYKIFKEDGTLIEVRFHVDDATVFRWQIVRLSPSNDYFRILKRTLNRRIKVQKQIKNLW